MTDVILTSSAEHGLPVLLAELGNLIRQARQQALRTVDTIQVHTCWELGRYIVEFEQGGASRAAYGKRLLPELSKALTVSLVKDSILPIFDICACFIKHFRSVTHCVTN